MSPPRAPRIGLIGVGRWGKVYIRTLRSLRDRGTLTHLSTSRPEHAELVPHPVKIMPDWRQLVQADDCDAVIIATPPHTHAEIVEACLDVGKPCLVEKPFCLDVATAERLHQRIQASGVPVLVDHTFLFHDAYRALKHAVAAAGEPIRVIVSEGMALGPFRTHTPALWDWCPHDLSLCLDLIGHGPEQVAALGGPHGPDGAPEQLSVRLDFPSGACAWIHAGRLSPTKRRNLSVFTDTQLYRFDDLAAEPLTTAALEASHRDQEGMSAAPTPHSIPLASSRPPMVNVLTYFLEGLAGGGERRYFNTQLAVDVIRLLARCDAAMRRQDGDSATVGARSTV